MKKYILLICSLFFAFGVFSCTNEGREFDTNDGKGIAFVQFVKGSETVAAKPAAYSTEITVTSTTTSESPRTYNLSVSSTSTAIEGTHYTLSSKTVTIPAGQHNGSVTLTTNMDNLTPETVTASFTIESDEAISYGKTMNVSMYLFFEVTWEWLLGTWIWTDYVDGDFDDECEVEITKIDDNTIGIFNIWEAEMTIEAIVDFDNARIAIKPSQPFWNYGGAYGFVYMDAVMGSALSDRSRTEPIIGRCSFDGKITVAPWAPILNDSGYNFQVFMSSSVLTRP